MSHGRRGFERARLVALSISPIVLALLVALLGSWTPGFSQRSQTVSSLGAPGQPHALAARTVFVVYGLVVIIGAPLLGWHGGRQATWVVRLVAVYGVAGIVVGLAPKVLPGQRTDVSSEIHVVATIVGGGAVLAAMSVVARWGPVRTDRLVGGATAAVTAVAAIVFPFTWGSQLYGVIERVLVVTAAGWIGLLAAWLLLGAGRLSTSRPPGRRAPSASPGRAGRGRPGSS